MQFISESTKQTEEFAQTFAKLLKPNDCIAFIGPMGMGKTAFVRGLVKGLDLKGEVCSPTFSLVNEYRGDNLILYHFDMYRVNNLDDLYSTGFFDYLETGNILAIEWSENISEVLPENTIYIKIERVDDNTRHIIIKGGNRFENTCS